MALKTIDTSNLWSDLNKIASSPTINQAPPVFKTIPTYNTIDQDFNKITQNNPDFSYNDPYYPQYIPAPTLDSIAATAGKVIDAAAKNVLPVAPVYVPLNVLQVPKAINVAMPTVLSGIDNIVSGLPGTSAVTLSAKSVSSSLAKVITPAVVASVQNDLNTLQNANPYSPSTTQAVKYVANLDQIRDVLNRFVADPVGMSQALPEVRDSFIATTSFLDKAISVGKELTAKFADPSQLKIIPSSVLASTNNLDAVLTSLQASPSLLNDNLAVRPSGFKEVSNSGLDQVLSDLTKVQSSAVLYNSDPNTFTDVTLQATARLKDFLTGVLQSIPDTKLSIMSAAPNGDKPPETLGEMRSAAEAALDKYNQKDATNGVNALIAEYYPELAGKVIQGLIDPEALARNIKMYIAAEQGGADLAKYGTYAHTPADYGGNTGTAFRELKPEEQKARIALLYKQAISDGVGVYVAARSTLDLINQLPAGSSKDSLTVWAKNGGMDELVNSDPIFTANDQAKQFLGSQKGQMIIGGSVAALGIAAALLTGGVALAAGGVLAGIFSVTELPNMFQYTKSLNIQDLKTQGKYAPDHEYNYEQTSKSTADLVDDLTFNVDKMDDKTRKTYLEEAAKSYAALGKSLNEESWALIEQGSYASKLQQYKDLGSTLGRVGASIDSSTGALTGAQVEAGTFTITPPKGGRVEVAGIKTIKGEPVVITTDKNREISYNVYDATGNIVDSKTQKLWPGYVGTDDNTLSKSFPAIKDEQAAAAPSNIRPVTLYVAPGQTAEMLGKVYTGGKEGTSYLVQAPVGTQASIKFSGPGSTPDILNTLVQDEQTQLWYKELQPTLVYEPKSKVATLVPNINEGQQLFIDGKEIVNPERAAMIDVVPGLHSVVIKEAGREDYTTTINAFAGGNTAIAGKGKEPFVPYSSGGSSGGGGGSSGGGSSYSSAPAETKIVFGKTLEGAQVFLDAVQLNPVIGTAYSTTAGYHALLAKLTGKADYEKQVYVGQGDTVEVNAVWSVGNGGVTTTEATQIVFGASLTGARIWLDTVEVAPIIGQAYATTIGYHAIKATKAGFQDWLKTIYVSANTTLNVDAAFEPVVVVKPPSTVAKITFGASVSGAKVWIDEVLLDVAPGAIFEYSEGYHGVKLTKDGFYDWIKTVYLAAGDTLTVSPVFEAKPVPVEDPGAAPASTTQRVYVNSQPFGAKILINDGFTGQWTPAYLDLERGLYKLTTSKTDYDDYVTYIWVGDVIAFGDTAIALAKIAAGVV